MKGILVKKYIMALTGIFLSLFLLGHLLGNLQLIFGTKSGFNQYAYFMTTNPFVKVLSYATYSSIILHLVYSTILTINNFKLRPIPYVKNKNKGTSWASRNMGFLGSCILFFLVFHMMHFWAKMHFTKIPTYIDEQGNTIKDLYIITTSFFKNGWFGTLNVCFYVLSMVPVGMHLSHGFLSAFRSLGIYHKKLVIFGKVTSFVIALLFAIVPVYIVIFL